MSRKMREEDYRPSPYCSKCGREADGGHIWKPLKMYRVPTIKRISLAKEEVTSWDVLCEDCVEEWLDEYEVKGDEE